MVDLSKELIQVIKEATPSGSTLVDTLTDIIPMSKEAAYRRLRGEINFTCDEAVKIVTKFNVSLDCLIASSQEDRYSVQMTCVGETSTDLYRSSFNEIIAILKKLKTCSNPFISISTNMFIPLSYTYKYETISKFRMYISTLRWDDNHVPTKMHETDSPPGFIELENELFRELTSIPTNYICTPELVQAYVRDIKHCQKINLITDEEVLKMKNETFCLLDDMERDATRGKNHNNVPFYMYLNKASFDTTTYMYYSSDEYEIVSMRLFGVGFYFFKDIRIINQMKYLKNALIKNSTLISVSGEKQRIEFFRNQRMLVDTL